MASCGSMDGVSKTLPPEWKEQTFKKIQEITRGAKFLVPSELSYYCSSLLDFRSNVLNISNSIHGMIMRMISLGEKLTGMCPEEEENDLGGVDDIFENYEVIVELVDNLLERVAKNIERASNIGREQKLAIESKMPVIVSLDPKLVYSTRTSPSTFRVLHSENIPRPQTQFEEKVDNANRPFVIKLSEKKNAMVPLSYDYSNAISKEELEAHMSTISVDYSSGPDTRNPYYFEITHIKYPESQLTSCVEQMYLPLEQTPLRWIDTIEKLKELSSVLDNCKEFGVDLEHHSYRSYLGFTCLIQISIRECDYIVDALVLRSHMQVLNSSFTNPKILKIFHSAEMDIKWLQRDFGIYVVNMFDTGQASRLLELPHHSLEYLLKRYCNAQVDKKYQLADWRIRPLADQMIKYARTDTHYLPYIYDRMKNELIEASGGDTNKLELLYRRSEQICCSTFVKELYDSEEGNGCIGWKISIKKVRPPLSQEQIMVFKALHRWRDTVARQEDESPGFVLPSALLALISQMMPNTATGLLEICRNPPLMVKQYAIDIVRLISDAREGFARELLESHDSLLSGEGDSASQKSTGTRKGAQDGTRGVQGGGGESLFENILPDSPEAKNFSNGGAKVERCFSSKLFPSEILDRPALSCESIMDAVENLKKRFFSQNFRPMSEAEKSEEGAEDTVSLQKSKKVKHEDEVSQVHPGEESAGMDVAVVRGSEGKRKKNKKAKKLLAASLIS